MDRKMVEVLELKHNLDVSYMDNIIGKLTWRNVSLQEQYSDIAFFLGKNGNLYAYSYEGVEYLVGSIVRVTTPAVGSTITTGIPSKAMFQGSWDAFALVGKVTIPDIGLLLYGGEIVGIRATDIENGGLQSYDGQWFNNVLTVSAVGAVLIYGVGLYDMGPLYLGAVAVQNIGDWNASNVVATLYCDPPGATRVVSGTNPTYLGTIIPGETKSYAFYLSKPGAGIHGVVDVHLSYIDTLTGETRSTPTPPGAPIT